MAQLVNERRNDFAWSLVRAESEKTFTSALFHVEVGEGVQVYSSTTVGALFVLADDRLHGAIFRKLILRQDQFDGDASEPCDGHLVVQLQSDTLLVVFQEALEETLDADWRVPLIQVEQHPNWLVILGVKAHPVDDVERGLAPTTVPFLRLLAIVQLQAR